MMKRTAVLGMLIALAVGVGLTVGACGSDSAATNVTIKAAAN